MEPHQTEKPHPQSPLHPSLKVPGRRALLQFPQTGPYGKRCPSPDSFYISFRVPSKEALPPGSLHRAPTERDTPHLQSPLHPSLEVPSRRALLQFPRTGPCGKRCPSPEPLLPTLQGPPARELSLQVPFTEFPQKETHHTSRAHFILLSKSPVDEPSSTFPKNDRQQVTTFIKVNSFLYMYFQTHSYHLQINSINIKQMILTPFLNMNYYGSYQKM